MCKKNLSIMVLLTVAVLVFITAGSVLGQTSPAMTQMATPTTTPAPTPTPVNPKEVPLGTTPADPNSAPQSPSLDLQVNGNSNSSGSGAMGMDGGMKQNEMGMMGMMDQNMMSMMNNMMGNMNNTNNMQNMNNSQPTGSSASNPVNLQLLVQLQTTNTMISQLLATFQNQPGGTSGAQLQPLYQLLGNQTALIQMIYFNLNNAAANQNSNQTNSGSMNGMSGSSGSSGSSSGNMNGMSGSSGGGMSMM